MQQRPNIFDQIRDETNQTNTLPYMFLFGKEKYKEINPEGYNIIHKFLANHGVPENEEIISVGQEVLGFVLIVTIDTILVIGNNQYNSSYDQQVFDFVKRMRPFDSKFTNTKKIKVLQRKI